MNKSDFIAAVADKLHATKVDTARNLEAVIETFIEIFKHNDTLILPGFATFGIKTRAARTGRNPRDGKALHIPETQAPFVRISPKLRKLLNTPKPVKAAKATKAGKIIKTTTAKKKTVSK